MDLDYRNPLSNVNKRAKVYDYICVRTGYVVG